MTADRKIGQSLILPAPAKLNLFLHVTGRREDGYHSLESVFIPISLADTVELRLRNDGVVQLLDPPFGLDSANDLACRAARALQIASGCKSGVDIRLVKRIPAGAGLGGGSSDAATTLLGLNRLWNLGLHRAELQRIGLSLGADVPFFVFGHAALARGVGEKLEAVTLPQLYGVVASPGTGVATGSVFTAPDLVRDTTPIRHAVFSLQFGRNDLQAVARALAPRIATLEAAFEEIGLAPRMTGSGSCVFALTHSTAFADKSVATLTANGWQSWSVRSMDQHPLFSFASSATI